jgi:hypothetical protein
MSFMQLLLLPIPYNIFCRMYHREAVCSRRWLGNELGKHGVQYGQFHRRVGCESAGALWTCVWQEVLALALVWRWRAGLLPSGAAPEVLVWL